MLSSLSEKVAWLVSTQFELYDVFNNGTLTAQAKQRELYQTYLTSYIGSKAKLIAWILENTPEDIEHVLDGFSGSGVVGFAYKTKGLRVTSCDALSFSFHVARSIIENVGETLSDEDITSLTTNNQSEGFVAENFQDLYFNEGVHAVIDQLRANIEGLESYRKDIALFALGKTCITGTTFGHFNSTQKFEGKRADSPDSFKSRFVANCKNINSLVVDTGQEHKAIKGDIREMAKEVEADLAYFDPPYATEFTAKSYAEYYHFVEGLMINWQGIEVEDLRGKRKAIPNQVETITRKKAYGFFGEFLSAAKHIPNWIISYRDKAFPTEEEINGLVTDSSRKCDQAAKEFKYFSLSDAVMATEYLFICSPDKDLEITANNQERFFGRVFADIADLQAIAPGWEETDSQYRYRVREPGDYDEDSFRSKDFEGVEGISIIIGKLKPSKVPEGRDKDKTFVQSLRFSKEHFTFDEAKDWYIEHRMSFADLRGYTLMKLSASENEAIKRALSSMAAWVETETEFQFRFRPPEEFDDWSLRAVSIEGAEGAFMRIGRLMPENVPPEKDGNLDYIQSFLFKKHAWTQEDAEAWFAKYQEGFDPALQRQRATERTASTKANFHTTMYGSLELRKLGAEAVEQTDKPFEFILTHIGTNKNGDHFTAEELQAAAVTAISKKVDLQHDQGITDIVGAISDAWFVSDGGKSRVAGTADLFTGESETARLAHKLMTKKIIGNVSMECDYEEGECSICGKRITAKADYCAHLKNYKGRDLKGKPVYEILHGVVFTGMGLLDKLGADAGALITQVANSHNQTGDNGMDKDKDKSGGAHDNTSHADDAATIKELQDKNSALEAENAELKQKLSDIEAEKAAAASKARAETLVAEWETRGRKFADDAERQAEVDKVAAYTDEAYAAVDAVVMNTPKVEVAPAADAADGEAPPAGDKPAATPPADGSATASAKASATGEAKPKADAGTTPAPVDDAGEGDLQSNIAGGLKAYREARRKK